MRHCTFNPCTCGECWPDRAGAELASEKGMPHLQMQHMRSERTSWILFYAASVQF